MGNREASIEDVYAAERPLQRQISDTPDLLIDPKTQLADLRNTRRTLHWSEEDNAKPAWADPPIQTHGLHPPTKRDQVRQTSPTASQSPETGRQPRSQTNTGDNGSRQNRPETPVTTDMDRSGPSGRLEQLHQYIERLNPALFNPQEKQWAMRQTPYEQETLRLINEERQAFGRRHRIHMNDLEFDPRLKLAALKKSQYANGRLSARDNLHYNGPPGFQTPQAAFGQVGFNDYRECADTLSGGTYERSFPPGGLARDWFGSAPHYNILMSPDADVAGISVVGDKAYINISNRRRSNLPI